MNAAPEVARANNATKAIFVDEVVDVLLGYERGPKSSC